MALLQIIYKANYDKHSILLPKIEIKARYKYCEFDNLWSYFKTFFVTDALGK